MQVSSRSSNGVFFVEINRPAQRNAVDRSCAIDLYNAFRAFESDPTLLVAILSGAGGNFCAGADLSAVASNDDTRKNITEAVEQNPIGPMGPTRLSLSKPVIAAIEGFAVAGGLELACWCDLRVVAQSATLGVFCRRWGVPLIDGGTVRLPRLIGQSRASDLILTGRPVSGPEALSIGLANRLVPDGQALAEATKLAQQIASFPPLCMRADRLSSLKQWSMSECAALSNEFSAAFPVLGSESVSGASRFSLQKVGRHGSFSAFASPSPASSQLIPVSVSSKQSDPVSHLRCLIPQAGQPRAIRAVLFDLGGVILESPVDVIEHHNRALGLPAFCLNRFIGMSSAFHRLEKGELDASTFASELENEALRVPELAQIDRTRLDLHGLFVRMSNVVARPDMLALVDRLKAFGYKTAALTNNWKNQHADETGWASVPSFATDIVSRFDLIVESCVEKIRKPDPEFFLRACARLQCSPSECLFLDDIAANCRSASSVGLHVLRVPLGSKGQYRRILPVLFALCPDAFYDRPVAKF
jgi:enoyl-CoA hydratase